MRGTLYEQDDSDLKSIWSELELEVYQADEVVSRKDALWIIHVAETMMERGVVTDIVGWSKIDELKDRIHELEEELNQITFDAEDAQAKIEQLEKQVELKDREIRNFDWRTEQKNMALNRALEELSRYKKLIKWPGRVTRRIRRINSGDNNGT